MSDPQLTAVFPVSLFVTAIADGVLAKDTQQKAKERLGYALLLCFCLLVMHERIMSRGPKHVALVRISEQSLLYAMHKISSSQSVSEFCFLTFQGARKREDGKHACILYGRQKCRAANRRLNDYICHVCHAKEHLGDC